MKTNEFRDADENLYFPNGFYDSTQNPGIVFHIPCPDSLEAETLTGEKVGGQTFKIDAKFFKTCKIVNTSFVLDQAKWLAEKTGIKLYDLFDLTTLLNSKEVQTLITVNEVYKRIGNQVHPDRQETVRKFIEEHENLETDVKYAYQKLSERGLITEAQRLKEHYETVLTIMGPSVE